MRELVKEEKRMERYLDIDRSTWQNYADAVLHPELAGICQGARTRIEA